LFVIQLQHLLVVVINVIQEIHRVQWMLMQHFKSMEHHAMDNVIHVLIVMMEILSIEVVHGNMVL
jgi:hypothetical protein